MNNKAIWIDLNDMDEMYAELYKCSNCGTADIGENRKYCSECGAEMEYKKKEIK